MHFRIVERVHKKSACVAGQSFHWGLKLYGGACVISLSGVEPGF